MSALMNLAAKFFADSSDDFTFHHVNGEDPTVIRQESGLYIHIPFCEHFCPYCPYNKIKFNSELALQYKDALIKEAGHYYELFGRMNMTSLYIGGGTPTLLIDYLEEILTGINKYFHVTGSLGIETHPLNINRKIAEKLKSIGFNLVSIGVQSFKDPLLKKIGRTYSGETVMKSLTDVLEARFETVNTDLIFAIKGQSQEDLLSDLKIADRLGANQITCYPLFTFPYSEIGELRELEKVQLPDFFTRRKLYYLIHEYFQRNGFNRTSVWSFNRNGTEKFSSVTRDYYIGLGAGAGSYNGKRFYFNTFSVKDYIETVTKKIPLSIRMEISEKLERALWMYWRLYETEIPVHKYDMQFHRSFNEDFSYFLKLLEILGFTMKITDDIITLSKSGAHYIHLLQNHLALNGVNRIWQESKQTAWPQKIKII